MEEEIIIPVDKEHRIKVYSKFVGDINDWRWYVEKQTKWLFWWLSSSWEKNGSLFMRVKSETFKSAAINEAEKIKDRYLSKGYLK